jgi:peptidoglycan/LPS O-acetylase OafA/YrhL
MKNILQFAFFDTFQIVESVKSINPILWTMHFEIVGSIFVFVFLLVVHRIKWPRITLWSLLVMLILNEVTRLLAPFVLGIIIADWRSCGLFDIIKKSERNQLTWFGIFACAAAISYLGRPVPVSILFLITTFMFVIAIFINRSVCSFLAGPTSRWLGRVSFALYLLHIPLMASLTSWLTVKMSVNGALTSLDISTIIIISVVGTLIASQLFQPVERFTKWFCDQLVIAPSVRISAAPT